MKRTLALLMAGVMAMTFALTGCKKSQEPASAAGTGTEGEPITIKVTTVQLDSQQMGVAVASLLEKVNERLAGKVEMLTYTGGQLYSNTEELEALKTGDIQMCLAIGSTMSTLDPALGIFKLPYLFPSVEAAYAILDGETGDILFQNLKDQGINVLGGFSSGSIIISNSKHPLETPEDLSGLKIRASGKMESAIIDSLGAISTVIPSEETFTGLEQKVVDGLATPSTVFTARRYHEVQPYVTNAGMLYWSNGFILANDEFWDGLPEDIRTELEAIVTEVLAETREADTSDLEGTLDEVEAAGCEVIRELTPEQTELWREATMGVYSDYEEEIGKELIETVQAAVAEYEA